MDRVGPYDPATLTVPYGSLAAWRNAAPQSGVEGSIPSVEAWTHAIEEIVYAIEQSGQTPDHSNQHQLWQAITKTIFVYGGRIVLAGNLNLYVNSATGSNANTGLTPASPFATIQYAYDFLRRSYDLNGFAAFINCAAGTYATFAAAAPVVGGSGPASVQIIGDVTTPANCLISGAGTGVGAVNAGVYFRIKGFAISTTGALLIGAANGGIVEFDRLKFLASGGSHIGANAAGQVIGLAGGSYEIAANGLAHMGALTAGQVNISNMTVTLTGTPAFSGSFANATTLGLVASSGCTFIGGATGARYVAATNSIIGTNGAGANYFPGSAAGVTATGGLYL